MFHPDVNHSTGMSPSLSSSSLDSFGNVSNHSSDAELSSFPDLTGNTVLVTGGAGFIGSHTADRLMDRGDRVIILDNLNDYYDQSIKMNNLSYLLNKFGSQRCKVYVGDVSNKELVHQIFVTEQPNLICHLAARAGVRASIDDPFTYLQANIEGTMVLLEESHKDSCKIDNFVYASSSSVYGNSDKMPLSETDMTDSPISPYAATKKACEVLAHTYSHMYGIKCSGLRFFTVYGPRGRPDMAIFKFIDRIYNGKSIDQYGDGSTFRDYTFVDDIVSGVVAALDTPRDYEVYNLGNGSPHRLSEMIEIIQNALNVKAKIKILPKQPGDVDKTFADVSKAQRILGYQPQTSLRIGLYKTVDWYLNEYIQDRRSTLTVPKLTVDHIIRDQEIFL